MHIGLGGMAFLAVLTIGLGAKGNLGRYCQALWFLSVFGAVILYGLHQVGEAGLAGRPEWQAGRAQAAATFAPRINRIGGRDMTPGILVTGSTDAGGGR